MHRGSSEEGKKNKRAGKREGCRFVKQKLNKMQHAGKDNKHKKKINLRKHLLNKSVAVGNSKLIHKTLILKTTSYDRVALETGDT